MANQAAHPRRCGENKSTCLLSSMGSGSSPQVRGKHTQIYTREPTRRLIPAGAGKTERGRGIQGCRSAHPRRCGENIPRYIPANQLDGSSPQVRGKHPGRQYFLYPCRLIPAGAGKPRVAYFCAIFFPAHPRRCGENLNVVMNLW